MKLLEDITALLEAVCQSGSDAILSGLARATTRACVTLWLVAGGLVMLLGAIGLMIAALFLALRPHMGAHWAAMIAAAAAMAGAGLFFLFARIASKMTSSR